MKRSRKILEQKDGFDDGSNNDVDESYLFSRQAFEEWGLV